MSAVTCEPAHGSGTTNGWPDELLGDGFIHLSYFDDDGDRVTYRDQFAEKIEVVRFETGLIVADVRED